MSTKKQNLVCVEDWIHWVAQQLEASDLYFGHGTDNAWDEAVQLVLFAASLPAHSGREVVTILIDKIQSEKIIALLDQRIRLHKPLPYLLNQAWFAGLQFYVDERVIIPRSPFAEWIEKQFIPWIQPENVKRILDLGTGSGCMAIAAAFAFPQAIVDAVDISTEALTVAEINVKRHQANRVNLIHSDVFSQVPVKKYDIIISNPPYVSEQEMAELPMEYRHEPTQALLATDQGLAVVDAILREAAQFLTKDGILVVEVGNTSEALITKYPRIPFIWLELEHGGDGLFLLTREDLLQCQKL